MSVQVEDYSINPCDREVLRCQKPVLEMGEYGSFLSGTELVESALGDTPSGHSALSSPFPEPFEAQQRIYGVEQLVSYMGYRK